jgi:hypothetical protein
VADEDVHEGLAGPPAIGRENPAVEQPEDAVLLHAWQARERSAGHRGGDLVHVLETIAVELAEADQLPEGRVVHVGAEELCAPADGLEARERDEAGEGVLRAAARRDAARVVWERVPVAERAARVDAGDGAVEGGEQALDIGRSTEVVPARIDVPGDDAIAEGRERGELAAGEEAAAGRGEGAAGAGQRRRERRQQDRERLQELAPAEQRQGGAGGPGCVLAQLGWQRGMGRRRGQPRELELRHADL